MKLLDGVEASAVVSDCGTYRYRLERVWDPKGTTCAFVMLNPSTADAETDDPTLRRCQGFARRWGHGRLVVVNLYALRSSDPKALLGHSAPSGPDNAWYLGGGLYDQEHYPSIVVAAWGNHAAQGAVDRFLSAADIFRAAHLVRVLALTSTGAPRHPLARGKHFIPDDVVPVRWP